MSERIIKSVHTVTVVTEIPFPEAFPNMNLTEAVEFQKNLDVESIVDCMMVGHTTYNTDVTVLPAPQEEEATRGEVGA